MQIFIILSVFGFLLVIISIALYLIYRSFKNITAEVIEKSIIKKEVEDIKKRVNLLEDSAKSHVQHLGLVRFNPFKELGGDHSFSLSVLDGNEDGIIITSLHTRDRTRVYMKTIKNGKSDVELSDEEKKALLKAIK